MSERRQCISYGPMEKRDRTRIDYLNNKIWKNDTTCVNMLRLRTESFFHFCQLFRDRGLLEDTIHMCVEQQVAMFLNTVGHNLRNRLVATNFDRSGETVSRYFHLVLHAVGELRAEYIRPPSLETQTKITYGGIPTLRCEFHPSVNFSLVIFVVLFVSCVVLLKNMIALELSMAHMYEDRAKHHQVSRRHI